MPTQIIENNLRARLAYDIQSSTVNIEIVEETGAWPAIMQVNEYLVLTLEKLTADVSEIVRVTGRTGNVLHCLRGDENTTPIAWLADDCTITGNLTAGTISKFLRYDEFTPPTVADPFPFFGMYQTMLDAQVAIIAPWVNSVFLLGRNTEGVGQGLYKRVVPSVDPGHGLAFQDFTGAWFEWDPEYESSPSLLACGAVSDADIDPDTDANIGTDSADAWDILIAYFDVKYRVGAPALAWRTQPPIKPGDGYFRISRSIDWHIGMDRVRFGEIDGTGCNLFIDGADTIGFDMTECQYLVVKNFKFRGCSVNTPICAIKHGRIEGNNTAAHMQFINNTTLHSVGSSHWRVAAKWDIASENTYEWRNNWHNDRQADPFTADTPLGNCYGAAYDCANFCAYDRGKEVTAIGTLGGDMTFTVAAHGWTTGDLVAPSRVSSTEVVPVGAAAEFRERAYGVQVIDVNTVKLRTYREAQDDYNGPQLRTSNYDTSGFVSFLLHKEHYASPFHGDRRCPPWTRQSQLQCRRWNIWSAEHGTAAVLQGSCDHSELDGYAKSQGFGILLTAAQYYPQSAFTELSLKLHVEPGQAPSPPDHAICIVALDSGAQKVQISRMTFIENASNADVSLIGLYDDELGSTHTVQFAGSSFSIGRARGTAGVEAGMLDTPSKYTFDGCDIFAEGAGVAGTLYVNIAEGSFAGGTLIDSETGHTIIVPERPTVQHLSGSGAVRPAATVVDFTSDADHTINTLQIPRFAPARCVFLFTNANADGSGLDIIFTNAGNIITGTGVDLVLAPGHIVQMVRVGDTFRVLSHA